MLELFSPLGLFTTSLKVAPGLWALANGPVPALELSIIHIFMDKEVEGKGIKNFFAGREKKIPLGRLITKKLDSFLRGKKSDFGAGLKLVLKLV